MQEAQIKRIFDSGDPLFSNPNEVKHLLQGIICVRLQGVGGHTLHEYTSPLTLHVIQEAMSGVPFIETYRDECNLFLGKDDMYAFDESLDAIPIAIEKEKLAELNLEM